MTDRKSEQYLRQSERAAADIATWPKWMQRNLEPLTEMVPDRRPVFICPECRKSLYSWEEVRVEWLRHRG